MLRKTKTNTRGERLFGRGYCSGAECHCNADQTMGKRRKKDEVQQICCACKAIRSRIRLHSGIDRHPRNTWRVNRLTFPGGEGLAVRRR